MVRIYTLTLAPSLDSATITPQIYPEGKTALYRTGVRTRGRRHQRPPAPLPILEAVPQRSSRRVARPANTWFLCWADENVPVATVEAKDWTRQNLHVHVEASGEQYRFVMPGAALNEDEFRQLEEQVLEIESGAILVISGSLPPGVKLEKLTQTDFRCAKPRDPLHHRQFWRSVKCSTGDW
ncbi:6-phosphofructokinase [Escherichia coli]|nr:6-phosphofructokinase [Escherichia coli]